MTTQWDITDESEVPQDVPAVETVAPDDSTNSSAETQNLPIEGTDSAAPVQEQPPTPAPTSDSSASDLDTQRRELETQRLQYEQTQERERVIKSLEQEALQMERSLTDQGIGEQDARERVYSHLQGRVSQIESENNSKQQQQVAQGKRNASVHYAKKYDLGLDSLADLEKAATPTEMETMAKTMSTLTKQAKEIAELKARLSPNQEFDSNTPTPAAATNDDRLLDAYLAGDRSDAATAAAAKLLGM